MYRTLKSTKRIKILNMIMVITAMNCKDRMDIPTDVGKCPL